ANPLRSRNARSEIVNARRQFWGAQAASLQLPAACRQHLWRAAQRPTRASRQAAETNRPAACAPQKSELNPGEQRHRFADNMSIGQTSPVRVVQTKPLLFSPQLHLPIQLIENSMRRFR